MQIPLSDYRNTLNILSRLHPKKVVTLGSEFHKILILTDYQKKYTGMYIKHNS